LRRTGGGHTLAVPLIFLELSRRRRRRRALSTSRIGPPVQSLAVAAKKEPNDDGA